MILHRHFSKKVKKQFGTILRFIQKLFPLNSLIENPFQMLDETSPTFVEIERFIVLLYNKTSTQVKVNEACKRNKPLENLPPTQDALLHVQRSIFQLAFGQ